MACPDTQLTKAPKQKSTKTLFKKAPTVDAAYIPQCIVPPLVSSLDPMLLVFSACEHDNALVLS